MKPPIQRLFLHYFAKTLFKLVSVWLSLDEESLENGLLEFIPQSYQINFKKEKFDTKSNFCEDKILNKKLIKTAVHTTLKRGDVVLFHCKTLYHANQNSTKKLKSLWFIRSEESNICPKNTHVATLKR